MNDFQKNLTATINKGMTAIIDWFKSQRKQQLEIQHQNYLQSQKMEMENYQIRLQFELVNIFKNCHMHRLNTITSVNDLLPLLRDSKFYNHTWHFYFTWSKSSPGEPIDSFILENLIARMNSIIYSYIKKYEIRLENSNNYYRELLLYQHPTFYHGFRFISATDYVDSVIFEVILGFPCQ